MDTGRCLININQVIHQTRENQDFDGCAYRDIVLKVSFQVIASQGDFEFDARINDFFSLT